MIAGFDPDDTNFFRQLVIRDLVGPAERVPRALDDQRRRAKILEMLDPVATGIPGRMERGAEAYPAGHARLIGDHARNSTAHRFSADYDFRGIAKLCDNAPPRV